MQTSNPKVPIGNDLYLKVVGPFDDEKQIYDAVVEGVKDSMYPVESIVRENLDNTIATYQIEDYANKIMICVHNKEDQIVGIICGMRSESNLFYGNKIAVEHFWWVHKDYRKSKAAMKLLESFEDWAKMVGCTHITMCHFNNETSRAVNAIFKRKKYSHIESSYIKEII